MAGLPDTIRRWSQAAEAVKAGQQALAKETPMDVSKWPVSNVTLEHPVGLPSDVAFSVRWDMPPGTPTVNRYDEDGQKLPDPRGLALSMVVCRIQTASHGVKLAEEVGLLSGTVFGNKDLTALWDRLGPGMSLQVRIVAWPRFYDIKRDGEAELFGPDRGYWPGDKVESPVYTIGMNEDGELTIDGKVMPKPVDPGPTPEEQAEIDRSDRQMREEREAHERRERETKDRAARANRENDERIERERREHETEQRRLREKLDAERRREDEEREAEKARASAERARLGIKDPGDVSKKLSDPPFEDRLCLAMVNMWESQYAPDDTDGFKERLRDLRGNMDFKDAVALICTRMNWTL